MVHPSVWQGSFYVGAPAGPAPKDWGISRCDSNDTLMAGVAAASSLGKGHTISKSVPGMGGGSRKGADLEFA